MIETNFNTVIDISSVIWDKDDFKENTHEYYNLISEVSDFFEKVKNIDCKILIRDKLLEEMSIGFPFDELPDSFHEYGFIVYSFLGKTGSNFVQYSELELRGCTTMPNQIKGYYKTSTKKEISYLMSNIHSQSDSESKFFTFKYLWQNNNNNLISKTDSKTNEYETIIADNGNDLDNFLFQFKLIFKHKKPKHDCSPHKDRDAWNVSEDKGNFQSQLSCYCEGNDSAAQIILDKRYKKCFGNNSYYSYDENNDVYVLFRITIRNIYHAYDIYDINIVPKEVKKQFNVWRY